MIRSFRDKEAEKLFQRVRSRKFQAVQKPARVKLALLNSAISLEDLRLPGLRLEKLHGDRKRQHSITINEQYRICFDWGQNGPENVEIADYH